jgi:hypothetical protein
MDDVGKTPMTRAKFIITGVLLTLLFIVPSSSSSLLDGIPWNSRWELGAISVVVLSVLSRGSREILAKKFYGMSKRRSLLLVVALVALLGARTWSSSLTGSFGYFDACYRSIIEPLPTNVCEPTYDGILVPGPISRRDQSIDFGPKEDLRSDVLSGSNWNFSFANDWPRFDIWPWVEGNIDIERFPFTATWVGAFNVHRQNFVLPISYVGGGVVNIDGIETNLADSYAELSTVKVPVGVGAHKLKIDYRFVQTRVAGDASGGPYATIKVYKPIAGAGIGGTLLRSSPQSGPFRLFALSIDLLTLFVAGYISFPLLREAMRRRRLICLAALGMLVAIILRDVVPLPSFLPLPFIFVIVSWIWLLKYRRESLLMIGIPLGIALAVERMVNFIVQRDGAFPGINFVLFRIRGNDWLVYQGLARSMLGNFSLRGGEDVFYWQAGFRYVVFVSHLLLGDGDVLIAFVFAALFVCAPLWLVYNIDRLYRNRGTHKLLIPLLALTLIVAMSSRILETEYLGLSEYVTWIALVYIVISLFSSASSDIGIATLGLVTGLLSVVRTNQVFGMFFLLIIVIIARSKEWSLRSIFKAVVPISLFIGGMLLPLAHNLYFGHKFVVLPTSGNPTNPEYSWSQFLRIFNDESSRQMATLKFRQFTYTAYFTEGFGFSKTLALSFWGFQFLWLVALISLVMIRSRNTVMWMLWMWPLMFAVPIIPYRLDSYYPRHFVVFNLALGISAVAVLIRLHDLHQPEVSTQTSLQPTGNLVPALDDRNS